MTAASEARAQALIVGADPALAALIEEWLDERGCCALAEGSPGADSGGPFDFIVLDVPYVRVKGLEQVRQVAGRYPGTPIIALSASFFAGVDGTGAVARSLGAACVLPKPLAREALLAAVHRLLQRAA